MCTVTPETVENAVFSKIENQWLVGDKFSYVCNGDLELTKSAETMCTLSAAGIAWSLKTPNLPKCSKEIISIKYIFFKCTFVNRKLMLNFFDEKNCFKMSCVI